MRRLLRRLVRSAPDLDRLRREPLARQGVLSLTFLDDAQMRAAHQAAFGTAEPTDVICFDYRQPDAVWTPHTPWAEILVDVDTARTQAHARHLPLPEEILRYLAHALLHLAGYDDQTAAESEQMRSCQESALSRLFADSGARAELETAFRWRPAAERARPPRAD